MAFVGTAEGCDLLIFGTFEGAENQDQKIAASFHSTAPTQLLHSFYTGLTGALC